MAEIIELERRRQLSKAEEEEQLREEKLQLLRRILHCSRCSLKCARCGTHIEEDETRPESRSPYPFCAGCQEEYDAYLSRRRGDQSEIRYWQNEAWTEVWRTWLRHQRALDKYRTSSEFITLLNEFERLS
ncbi:MAG TPA: hypothetical protein VEI04_09715 [Syntrophobacteria bacterium]|nr:hypothetical protein [Syntrophobacteria bacterium]